MKLALPYGRGRLMLIAFVVFLNGFIQVIGVVSVFPFFALAANPGLFRQSYWGQIVLGWWPVMTDRQLLIACGVVALVSLLAANLTALFGEIIRSHYVFSFGHWLRCRMVAGITAQPYGYFLTQNSSGLLQKVLNDTLNFIQNVFMPLTDVLSRFVTLVFLVGIVCFLQPGIALVAVMILGGVYALIFFWIRPKAQSIGRDLQAHNRGQFITAQQLMSGIKPILIHGKKDHFIGEIQQHSAKLVPLYAWQPVYSSGPKYIIEPLLFGSMIGCVLLLALQGKPLSTVLPTLVVLAFAGYRIMPTIQLLYMQLAQITTWAYTLAEIEKELCTLSLMKKSTPEVLIKDSVEPLLFKQKITLENIYFSYPGAKNPVLTEFNLTIFQNRSIGIVGTTGSGKSTLVDLILGLHRPQGGKMLVDGVELTPPRLAAWRAQIGYVPQDIFLLDDTIAANIAFGVPLEKIDKVQLRNAADAAKILYFIENELPLGFDAVVGERGVRLSGGQRQRIGLARALYHKPKILILDEATSALDQETEAEVMKTIKSLHGNLTMLIIAHRLSTIEGCDEIIKLHSQVLPA
ncbi:MAG TPA: ABC transporter ATP-binding protein [Rariglobus sp.]|nr:ABC transporter ATP-binding protein [Rariglobus sp.]